jgi:acyl-coenzyme A thioesterase PaaI-like protein
MGGMAKTKHKTSHALAPYRAPRASAPIIVRVPSGVTKQHKAAKKHHRNGGKSSEKILMGLAMGGFAMGFLDKPGGPGANIPTIPILGKAGTIALAAHFFGKGRAGLVTDIRNAAAVVAAYEFGLKGSVSGEGDLV